MNIVTGRINCCALCGQVIPVIDLDPEMLKLPRRERQVLQTLVNAKGRTVAAERIEFALYGDEIDGGPLGAPQVTQSHISKLRKKLRPLGWAIETRRFEGYRLVRLEKGMETAWPVISTR